MECAICLSPIKETDKIAKLSCNHVFHHSCFFTHALKSAGSVLAKCPLCRKINATFPEPSDNLYENMVSLTIFHRGKKRCGHKTQKGTVCKKRAVPFNYGYCKFHHPNTLPEEFYEPFYDFLKYILIAPNNWRTKVFLIDLAKQLCINHQIKKGMDLHIYFVSFFQHIRSKENDDNIVSRPTRDPHEIYEYYDLIFPPEEWVETSIQDRVVI